MKKEMLIGFLFFISSISPALAKGDISKGKTIYNKSCVACHGAKAQGNKAMNAPSIAGQMDWYLSRQLNNFKSGIRGTAKGDSFGAQMRPMSMTLVDKASVENVSAYISSLKPGKNVKTIKGDITSGKAKYATCTACHGAKGEGNQAMNAPRLNSLSDWYIAGQLKAFKAGHRGVNKKDSFGIQMRPMAMMLSDDKAVNDVTAYITSLSK